MKQTGAVIEFGTSKITALFGDVASGDRLDILGYGMVPYAGFRRGQWQEPDKLGDSLRQAVEAAETAAHRKMRDVCVALPDELTHFDVINASVTVATRNRQVDERTIDNLIRQAEEDFPYEDHRILHSSVCYFVLDNGQRVSDPVGMASQMLSAAVSFVSVKEEVIAFIEPIIRDCGLSPTGYASPAYGEMMYLFSPEERDSTVILVDAGYYSTTVSVITGDGIQRQQVIPLGGCQIAGDLAYCFDLPEEQAELLKRRYVFGLDIDSLDEDSGVDISVDGRNVRIADRYIQDVIEARTGEIANHIKHAAFNFGELVTPNTPIALTGGGMALMRGVRDFLAVNTNRPVRIVVPESTHMNNPMFSAALGVLDVAMEEGEPTAVQQTGGALKKLLDKITGFFYE